MPLKKISTQLKRSRLCQLSSQLSLRVRTPPQEKLQSPFSSAHVYTAGSAHVCTAGSKCKKSHRSHHHCPVTLPHCPVCLLQVDDIKISVGSFLFFFFCKKYSPPPRHLLEATLNHRTNPAQHTDEMVSVGRLLCSGPLHNISQTCHCPAYTPWRSRLDCQKPQIHCHCIAAAKNIGQTSVFITALSWDTGVHSRAVSHEGLTVVRNPTALHVCPAWDQSAAGAKRSPRNHKAGP